MSGRRFEVRHPLASVPPEVTMIRVCGSVPHAKQGTLYHRGEDTRAVAPDARGRTPITCCASLKL